MGDLLLLGGWGFGLIVLSTVGSMFDQRYGLPALALLPAGGALALHRLRSGAPPAQRTGEDGGATEGESPRPASPQRALFRHAHRPAHAGDDMT